MVIPSFLSDLDPSKRAQFATAARLISSLVTESIVPAFFHPISHADAAGFAFVLTSEQLSRNWRVVDNFLCIVPLHHSPILKDDEHAPLGKKISLLDPLDMMPLVFAFGTNLGYEVKLIIQILVPLTFSYRKPTKVSYLVYWLSSNLALACDSIGMSSTGRMTLSSYGVNLPGALI